MIISQTPFRISFFGGGTDYPSWYTQYGGATLVSTIDKYCHISCRYLPPFFAYRNRLVYSMIETFDRFDQVKHPAVRAALECVPFERGLEIHHDGDLPARSGLASSSAFTVGLLNTLYTMKGEAVVKQKLAREAIRLEQEVMREAVGSQDQVATAYGGLNQIEFFSDNRFSVVPVPISRGRKEKFENHLMLFFTGFQRDAQDLARKQIENCVKNRSELFVLREMVDEASSILANEDGDLFEFGDLLHESWMIKRRLAEGISTTQIDEIYEAGRTAGATGGKLLGAGGGGFMLFFVRPKDRPRMKEKLKNLVHVDFRFENAGSRVALHDPDF